MITAPAEYQDTLAKAGRTPIYQIALHGQVVSSPSGYWTLDEPSGTRADSAGTNTLTDNNTVTSSAGKIGNAGQFTAANSEYLNCTVGGGNVLQLGSGVEFTFCCWVYFDADPSTVGGNDQYLISQWNETSASRSWRLRWSPGDGRFEFAVFNGTSSLGVTAPVSAQPVHGVWYFIVCWRDSSSINIQVNNEPIVSKVTALYAQSSTLDFRIGAGHNGTTIAYYMNGRIDEASFWRKTLTSSERNLLYNAGTAYPLASFPGNPSYVCTAHPIGGEYLGLEILEPLTLDRSAEIDFCRFPLSVLEYRLIDINNQATALVSAGIVGQQCDLYAGFWDLASSGNLVQIFGGIVTETEFESGVYRVTARSRMAAAQTKVIFNAAQTQLTAAINSTDTTVSVKDTSAFQIPGAPLWGDTSIALLADSEYIFATGKTTTAFTVYRLGAGVIYGIPPDIPGTGSTSHVINTFIRELVDLGKITGINDDSGTNNIHPIDLFTWVVQNENPKSAIGRAGIMTNDTDLAAARTTLGANLKFVFQMEAPQNAKKFVEEQIYQACAMYPREDGAGKIGAKLYQNAAAATPVAALTDADITQLPRWLRNAERLVNTVIVHYDYVTLNGEFTSTFEYRDEAKIIKHGRELPIVIDSRGIRSLYVTTSPAFTWFGTTAAFLTSMAQRQIARFGDVAPILSVQTLMGKQLLQVGDDVSCTFSQVVNLSGASRQITNQKFEIMAMRMDFQTNLIDMELLGYP